MAVFHKVWPRLTSGAATPASAGWLVLHQLKRLLSDDCLVWHDIPVGTQARQPDSFIFSPRQGLLALEVKETRRPGA